MWCRAKTDAARLFAVNQIDTLVVCMHIPHSSIVPIIKDPSLESLTLDECGAVAGGQFEE